LGHCVQLEISIDIHNQQNRKTGKTFCPDQVPLTKGNGSINTETILIDHSDGIITTDDVWLSVADGMIGTDDVWLGVLDAMIGAVDV